MLSEYTVPWVAAEANMDTKSLWSGSTPRTLGSRQPAGPTLSSLVATKEDAELDLAELKQLLQRVQKTNPPAAEPRTPTS